MTKKIQERGYQVTGSFPDKMEANREIIIKATLMTTIITFLLLAIAFIFGNKQLVGGLIYFTCINFGALIAHYWLSVKTRNVVYYSTVFYALFLATSPALVGTLDGALLIIIDLILFNWFFGRGERFRFHIIGFLILCALIFYIFAYFLNYPPNEYKKALDLFLLCMFFGFLLYILFAYQNEIASTEKAYLTNEQRYQALFDNNPLGIAVVDKEGQFSDSNSFLQQISGYSRDELLQQSVADFWEPNDEKNESQEAATFEGLVQGKYPVYHTRKDYRRKDGSILKCQCYFKGIYDESGQFIYAIASILDNTQKIESENALIEREEHYRTLFENTPLGVIIVDLDREKRGLDCNRKMHELFRTDRDSILNGNMLIFSPEQQPNGMPSSAYLSQVLNEYRSDKSSKTFEWQFKRADGTLFDAEVILSPMNLQSEERELMLVKDIAEYKKAADELGYSLSLLSATLESTADGLLVVDKNRKVNRFNRKFLELWHLREEELTEPGQGDILKKVLGQLEDPVAYLNRVDELYHNQESVSFDTFNLKDGRVFERYSQPQKINLDIVGRVWSFRDITQKHYAEQALLYSEAKYRTLFENAFDGILIYNYKERKVIHCNRQMADFLGVSIEIFVKSRLYDFLPVFQPCGRRSADLIGHYVEKTLKVGKTQHEWVMHRMDGQGLNAEVTVFQLPKPNTELLVVIFKDMTDKKRQEAIIQNQVDELNQKNIDLERYIESNMQLENFAYIASHDLKAPMRTIVSFSQLLERSAIEKLTKKEKDYLHFIVSATYNMRSLVEDLLAYSRVNSQKHQISNLNIPYLLEEIIAEMHTTIKEKNASISLVNLPDKIVGDPTKIRQLFQNLIANAVKFFREGVKPVVTVGCEEQNDKWKFYVKDNGIGIKQEFHSKIFLLFRKLHGIEQYEGTGIGLALCKKIVEQHKGKIWLESQPGEGTTFYFNIPKQIKQG